MVTALPYTDYKRAVIDSLESIHTHAWVVASKDKLSNDIRLSEYNKCLQLEFQNWTNPQRELVFY